MMSREKGMYGRDKIAGKGTLWPGMKPNDMRPKEDFKQGYLVDCINRPQLHDGRILKIDADIRLARVEWSTGQVGWWYLKDLTIVKKYFLKSSIDYEKGKSVIANDGQIWYFMPSPKIESECNV